MAIPKKQPLQPIRRAQRRRSVLPAYFDLGGKGLFILVVLAASLLALLALAQTGQAVAVGYDLRRIQRDERSLRWEREALLKDLATTIDPARLYEWAEEHDWRWLRPQEVIYVPLVGDTTAEGSVPVASEP